MGEITAWSFGREGRFIDVAVSRRVARLPLGTSTRRLTLLAGAGPRKVAPLRAALRGLLVPALASDELTAGALLADD